MQVDPRREVIVLGDALPYEDGAEDRILEILESACDRTSTSDELASHISDWPTKYHFSRLRRNIFEPFRIGPGMRVLEIGCGTGANLCTLAETGAEVVGVEGSLSRARAARVRTLEHDNVTVFAGDVAELPEQEPFDVVALIGVLEYSTAASGGARGPIALIQAARSLLRSDGALIIAYRKSDRIEVPVGPPRGPPRNPLGGPRRLRRWRSSPYVVAGRAPLDDRRGGTS